VSATRLRPLGLVALLGVIGACHAGDAPPARGAASDPDAAPAPSSAMLDVLAPDFDSESIAPASDGDPHAHHHHHEGMQMPTPTPSASTGGAK
jgi:hypothetical protein